MSIVAINDDNPAAFGSIAEDGDPLQVAPEAVPAATNAVDQKLIGLNSIAAGDTMVVSQSAERDVRFSTSADGSIAGTSPSPNEDENYYVLLRGSASVGNTLAAGLFNKRSHGAETGASYRWQQDVSDTWTDIVGSTSTQISVTSDLFGRRIRLLATPNAFNGSKSIASDGIRVTSQNPIVTENRNIGTTDWKITNLARNHEIEGYADATSVNAGRSLHLMISLSAAGQYDLEVYRLGYYGGAGGRLMVKVPGLDGVTQSSPIMTNSETRLVECLWGASYTLRTSEDWTSGLYIVKLTDCGTKKESLIPFVLRNDNRPSDIGFQDAVTTAQAYNVFGGFCAYDAKSTNTTRAYQLSFDRPYDATCLGFSNSDGYNCNNMLTWEYNMVRWLESQGYDVSYFTNMDVHTNPSQLFSQRIFLSVGHDEYWSMEQRDRVELARDNGINLAFFSANTAYWQVRFDCSSQGRAHRVVTIYKDTSGIGTGQSVDPVTQVDPSASTSLFRGKEVDRPENALIGVGYVADHSNVYEGFDFVVSNAADLIYAHTHLENGDKLRGLVGYEWDAVLNNDKSPDGLVILSESFTRANDLLPPLPAIANPNVSHATRYIAASGATVFAAGSIQWVWGLDNSWVSRPPPFKRSRRRRRLKKRVKNLLHFAAAVPTTSVPSVDNRAQQMTVNLFSEMGVKPQTPSSQIVLSSGENTRKIYGTLVNGQRILGFDGLRAIAFLAVFVSHKVPSGRLEAVGTTGVWLFFVLSGFLITRILAFSRENIEQRSATFSSSLKGFFLRRTARILPVYYAFLAIITSLVWFNYFYAGTSERLIANWLFVTNIYVERHGWETDLGHLWSLAVEEQFYLSFAPLALLVPRRRLSAVCVGLVITSIVAHVWLWLNRASIVVFDASSLANLGLLALGGWAGLNADRPLPKLLLSGAAVAANVVTIFVLSFLLARTGLWPVVGRLSGFLIVLVLLQVFQNQRSSAVQILDARWVREIGLVSFGAYLFHPIIHSQVLLGYFDIGVSLPRVIPISIDLLLTLALAEISWRLFERPIRHVLRPAGYEDAATIAATA